LAALALRLLLAASGQMAVTNTAARLATVAPLHHLVGGWVGSFKVAATYAEYIMWHATGLRPGEQSNSKRISWEMA